MPYATISRTGNSATVAIPAEMRKRHGIAVGDRVEIVSRPDGVIEIAKVGKPVKGGRHGLLSALEFFESLPRSPWPGDMGKESDREMAAGRYV